jgi:hypothetical protein
MEENHSQGKPFTLEYKNKSTGVHHAERPRLMISVDGTEKALVVGVGPDIIKLVSGAISDTDEHLWMAARLSLHRVQEAERELNYAQQVAC